MEGKFNELENYFYREQSFQPILNSLFWVSFKQFSIIKLSCAFFLISSSTRFPLPSKPYFPQKYVHNSIFITMFSLPPLYSSNPKAKPKFSLAAWIQWPKMNFCLFQHFWIPFAFYYFCLLIVAIGTKAEIETPTKTVKIL